MRKDNQFASQGEHLPSQSECQLPAKHVESNIFFKIKKKKCDNCNYSLSIAYRSQLKFLTSKM